MAPAAASAHFVDLSHLILHCSATSSASTTREPTPQRRLGAGCVFAIDLGQNSGRRNACVANGRGAEVELGGAAVIGSRLVSGFGGDVRRCLFVRCATSTYCCYTRLK